jgi:hypothetical protein
MVKATVYLKIAKAANGRFLFKASSRPNTNAIAKTGYNQGGQHYPTIHTQIELDIDEAMFAPAKLQLKVNKMNSGIAAEVKK